MDLKRKEFTPKKEDRHQSSKKRVNLRRKIDKNNLQKINCTYMLYVTN